MASTPVPPPSKRFASSTEVARLAGVSQSAVSRTYTPGASVSARTRGKVLAAAAALGYQPNLIPRIMLTDRSHLVGVVVGGLDNPYYAVVLDRFAVALRAAGQQVVLVRIDTGLALDGALDQLTAYRVDAVLTAIPVRTAEAAAALSALRVPVVCFNADVTAERVFSVQSDNQAAGRQAARLLHAKGARRFGFLAAPAVHAASLTRGAGFREALAELGMPAPAERVSDDSYEGGYDMARAMFASAERPDGLFCSNDLMACGAIDALRMRHGLRVPHDVLVIGYDDIPQAAWHGYDLTSFDQQPDRMIAAALEILANALRNAPARDDLPVWTVSALLRERQSTAGLAP